MKMQKTWNNEKTLKKVEGIILPNFKTHYKAEVIKCPSHVTLDK